MCVLGITPALFKSLIGAKNLCNSHKDELLHFTSSVDKEEEL